MDCHKTDKQNNEGSLPILLGFLCVVREEKQGDNDVLPLAVCRGDPDDEEESESPSEPFLPGVEKGEGDEHDTGSEEADVVCGKEVGDGLNLGGMCLGETTTKVLDDLVTRGGSVDRPCNNETRTEDEKRQAERVGNVLLTRCKDGFEVSLLRSVTVGRGRRSGANRNGERLGWRVIEVRWWRAHKCSATTATKTPTERSTRKRHTQAKETG